MPKTWTTEIEEILEVEPDWDDHLVPRCRIMGQRPTALCEPAVDMMADLLSRRTP
jgi:hypothetical protein